MQVIVIAVSLTLCLGCTRADPQATEPDPEPETPDEQPTELTEPTEPTEPTKEGAVDQSPVSCATLAACKKHEDKTVRVIGSYEKFYTGVGKGRSHDGRVQIALPDGEGPVLGRYWHDESKRDASEIARFEGKRVAVVGTFRAETPPKPGEPDHAARLSIPALLDVASIELASEDEGSTDSADDAPDPADEPLDPREMPKL